MGNPAAIMLGPGKLYYAASLSTPEVVDVVGAWPVGWINLGYTDEGSKVTLNTNFEDVEVAEELDPVAIAATKRTIMVAFALAEITATNLKRVANGGSITAGSGCVLYDPPALGQELYCMLGWEADSADERWIFRKCIQTGSIEITRKKSPDKATFPAEYRAVKPAGLQPYRAIYASPARA